MQRHITTKSAGLALVLGAPALCAAFVHQQGGERPGLQAALTRAQAALTGELPATVEPGGAEARELGALREAALEPLRLADQLELLRLRDGSMLFAAVTAHSEAGLDLLKLEDGGRLDLPWLLLDPVQERELQRRFGYISEEVEELLATADVIPLLGGQELVGRIELRSSDVLHVKTRAGVTLLPTGRIAGAITQKLVPAGDLYTRDELYARALEMVAGEIAAGGEAARGALLQLAQSSAQIGDHVHAFEAWQELAARAGAGEFEAPIDLEASLSRAELKAAAQAESDLLGDIERLARRGRVADARQELAAWRGAYEDSALLEDADKLEARIDAQAVRDLAERVRRRVPYWTARLVRDAARDMETPDSAKEWVTSELPGLVFDAVVSDVEQIDPDISREELEAVWGAREGVRARQASYGAATWMLGEAEALAGLPEQASTEELTGVEAERAELLERIGRYQRNQEALAGRLGSNDGPDKDEMWVQLSPNDRTQWMTAYAAEKSNLYEPGRISFLPHSACGGLGYFEIIDMGAQGAQPRTIEDIHCGGLGKQRQVVYR